MMFSSGLYYRIAHSRMPLVLLRATVIFPLQITLSPTSVRLLDLSAVSPIYFRSVIRQCTCQSEKARFYWLNRSDWSLLRVQQQVDFLISSKIV